MRAGLLEVEANVDGSWMYLVRLKGKEIEKLKLRMSGSDHVRNSVLYHVRCLSGGNSWS
jgi:hypothetical protein